MSGSRGRYLEPLALGLWTRKKSSRSWKQWRFLLEAQKRFHLNGPQVIWILIEKSEEKFYPGGIENEGNR